MAVGDNFERINLQDRWIVNNAGDVLGVQANSAGLDGRFLSEAQLNIFLAGLVNVAADSGSLSLTTAMSGTTRVAAGTQTYTIDAATLWSVGGGAAIFLPSSGTVSFAVSGGPTLNGGTSTLNRTLASNPLGYVVVSRISGTTAYSLSGV